MEKLRIIVGGMVGQFPLGGPAWDYLQYVLALSELGHEVYYHEDTWVWPLHPVKGHPDEPHFTVAFFERFFKNHAPHLADNWCYVFLHDKHYGMSQERFREVCRTADVYINVSGACFVPEDLGPGCRTVFLDTDPGYNQVVMATHPTWVENVARWEQQVRSHDLHFTYAENIHSPDCGVPKLGLDWQTTRPVACLGPWADCREIIPAGNAPFTTVMTWKYYPGALEWQGAMLEQKGIEFEKFQDLPRHTHTPLELAIGGEKYDLPFLTSCGWGTARSLPISLTPEAYHDYILLSAGEWSIAKNVYVALKTGWFSCRTACYLAAGRPAVVQETGWSKYIPSGAGVFAFSTLEEAVEGLRKASDLSQREAAYEIAREYLAPDRVLTPMLEAIGGTRRGSI